MGLAWLFPNQKNQSKQYIKILASLLLSGSLSKDGQTDTNGGNLDGDHVNDDGLE